MNFAGARQICLLNLWLVVEFPLKPDTGERCAQAGSYDSNGSIPSHFLPIHDLKLTEGDS